MKKPLKITAILFGLFVALPIIAISIALLIVDPNEYKPQIEALVQEQTGRELSIDGDIKLSVFPWLGVELGRITLANANGFGPEAFAKIEHAKVKVHLVPLLNKEVEVSAITLSGLELNLAKDKTGKTNWADLTQTNASPQDPPATSASSTTASSSDDATNIAALTIGIGGLHVNNATLNWHDETTNTQHSIQGLNLTTGNLSLGEPIDIEVNFALNSNQPPVDAQVEFSANIEPDLNNIEHRINNAILRVTFNAKEPTVSGEIALDSHVLVNMETQHVELPQFKITSLLDVADNNLTAKSKLEATIIYNIGEEKLSVTQTNLNILATGMDFPPEGVTLQGTTQAELNLKQQTLNLDTFTLSIADILHVSTSLQGTSIIDKPHLTGTLNIAPFNPRQLLQALGQPIPQTQSDQVLNHAELSLAINAKPNFIKLTDLILRLDQSTLTSQLQVKNLDNPAIALNADLDHFNLDHYLPPTEKAEATPPPANDTTATEPLSLEPIRALNLDGQINIGELTASNLKVSDIAITLKADKGKINIHPLKARLYEGHYSGDIQLNAQGDTLSTSLNETLTGIQAGPFLKDLIDNDLLQGKGDLKFKLSADGLDVDEIMQTLTGNVAILFRDGAVNGFNLGKILRDARARLQGKEISKDDVSKTDFAELSASLELKEGVAHNSDLKFKSPLLRLTGKGDIYYIKQTLNYLATVTIVGTSKGQGGKEMAELKGLPIDVSIKGTFTEPKFKVDLASALKARAKAKAKEKAAAAKQKLNTKLNESKEKLNDKLEDELKNQLKKIF